MQAGGSITMYTFNAENEKWGYLRETKDAAQKAGKDADTGLHRTGLDEYLAIIFPTVEDWIHDKVVDTLPKELKCRKRPDYRSETLKLIIEFDGVQHYNNPQKILDDFSAKEFYEKFGYKVVRLPFFIQLTNKAVSYLFDVDVDEPLFNVSFPSMGPKGITPACICGAGLYRMANEFKHFPEQYQVNLDYLKSFDKEYLTGAKLLETIYNSLP